MPDTVYIIGAGASHGESLGRLSDLPAGLPELHPHPPPLTKGFFDKRLLDALSYGEAEQDFVDVIAYIRGATLVNDAFGEGAWASLDLEEVLTSLEIEREFHNPESDEGARLLLIRNKLTRYIRRILGFCTQHTYGENYRRLVQSLDFNDSVITFNWDLLIDQEFMVAYASKLHYGNFFNTVAPDADSHLPSVIAGGLLLKLHGSLNWFRCGNHKCRASASIKLLRDVQGCLSVTQGIGDVICWQCGSAMNPVIIPPLLRKPITEDPLIRSAWGLARSRLLLASKVVVVGFSAAPTDFYTSWLLRSNVGTREDVEVIVINPSNRESDSDHQGFKKRMDSIFLRGYNSELHEFSQIGSVLGNPDGQAAAG